MGQYSREKEMIEMLTGEGGGAVVVNPIFSAKRVVVQPPFTLPPSLVLDLPKQMDGLALLRMISPNSVPLASSTPNIAHCSIVKTTAMKACRGSENALNCSRWTPG
jgi:hypothetical protein